MSPIFEAVVTRILYLVIILSNLSNVKINGKEKKKDYEGDIKDIYIYIYIYINYQKQQKINMIMEV